jgi:hypothetical protein
VEDRDTWVESQRKLTQSFPEKDTPPPLNLNIRGVLFLDGAVLQIIFWREEDFL